MSESPQPAVPTALSQMIDYQAGSTVSQTLIKKPTGTVTLFAFDAGEALSEHTAPFDALVTVLDGEAVIEVAGRSHEVGAGQSLMLPADVPHALRADVRFKMMLVMIREG